MRTTVRIDDDLLRELRNRAKHENVALAVMLNRVLREGLKARSKARRRPFRQKTFPMGKPLVDLTKALSLAAEWDDEETVRKLALGK